MGRRTEASSKSWRRLSRHSCSICSDKASGKHYGVYSCEGCKGFFKRTVRKDMQYQCKENGKCLIDKRHRNRCQACRFEKCMLMGMRKEAVQEERHLTPIMVAEVINVPMSSATTSSTSLQAGDIRASTSDNSNLNISISTKEATNTNDDVKSEEREIYLKNYYRKRLLDFAFQIPAFQQLPPSDQSSLIFNAYCELIICDLALDLYLDSDEHTLNASYPLFYRRLYQLVDKLGELPIDKMMMGGIKLIFLLDNEAPYIKLHEEIEERREKVYNCLLDHCLSKCPRDSGLFTQLLLRIATIRSIAAEFKEDILMLSGDPKSVSDILIFCENSTTTSKT